MKERIRIKISAILLCILCLTAVSASAQPSDKEQVLKQIETLFDGMRAGDSSKVAQVFTPDATIHSIFRDREGKVQFRAGSLNAFKNAVGTPHDQIWDERVANIKVNVDGDMAVAWVPYSFYLGDNFSHCGVNSFQFMKTPKGWKAISIVDTRRRTNCVEDL